MSTETAPKKLSTGTFVDRFVEKALKFGSFSFDVEHDESKGPHDLGFSLWGCAFATDGIAAYVQDLAVVKEICSRLFQRDDIFCVAHNAKYDIKCLKLAGIIDKYPKNLVCTMILVNILEDWRSPKQLGLKQLVKAVFKRDRDDYKVSSAAGRYSEKFHQYARDDALDTLRLWVTYKDGLYQERLDNLFFKILMPSTKVFADIETAGIGWDMSRAFRLEKSYDEITKRLEQEIYSEIGIINLNSPQQLADRLFNDLGISTVGVPLTAKGKLSTAVDVLEQLAKRYPICEKILMYRTCAKMRSTYVTPIIEMCRDRSVDKRIHSSFWLVSSTGRTRSSGPNVQNLPTFGLLSPELKKLFDEYDVNIRENIVSKPGWSLAIVDFSQIELRMIAHITKEPRFVNGYCSWKCTVCRNEGATTKSLHSCPICGAAENEKILKDESIEGFWQGMDLHSQTANSISVFKGNRQLGKTGNFELVYGATAHKMAMEHPELSKDEWFVAIKEFFSDLKRIKAWHTTIEHQLEMSGVCGDVFGRKRRLLKYEIKKSRKHALNQLVNFGPQASACNLGQLVMSKLWERWNERGVYWNDIFISNFVHDEIVFEIRDDLIDEYIPEIQDVMENSVQFRVPIRVDIKISKHWNVKG